MGAKSIVVRGICPGADLDVEFTKRNTRAANIMATTYEQLAPGYEFPPARYELTSSLVSQYLKAVDNPDELRVFEGFVPPLAMAAYAMAEMSRCLSLPPGSIHASQEFEFFKLVPVGAVVDCQAKVVKKLTRGTLRMLVLGIDVFDQGKQKVQSGKATVILPTQGLRQMVADFREGNPLPSVAKDITQEGINLYADASGDFNPIHVDESFAAETPLGGTIAHGMLVLAYVSEMMTLAFGQSWLSAGKLSVRFRAPARPGDRLTIGGRIDSIERKDGVSYANCSLECHNQRGEAIVVGEAVVQLPQG